jgi:hypothetical protein
MTILTVKPRSKKELIVFKKVLKALDADFELSNENENLYNAEFIERILETKKQKSYKIDPRNLWESIQ